MKQAKLVIQNEIYQAELMYIDKTTYINDVLVFKIQNRSDRSYCFYLLGINPEGTVQMIFPTSDEINERYACINAHQVIKNIHPLQLNQKGEIMLKLIASSKPIKNIALLERGRSELEQSRGYQDSVESLAQLLSNSTLEQRSAIYPQWAADQIFFEVK